MMDEILSRWCVGKKCLGTTITAIAALALLGGCTASQGAPAPTTSEKNPRPTSYRLSAAELSKFDGGYQLEPNSLFVIWHIGNALFGQLNLQRSVLLYPRNQTTFFAYRESDLCPMEGLVEGRLPTFPWFCNPERATTVRFVTDANGKADELILYQNDVERHASRIDKDTATKVARVITDHSEERQQSPGTAEALRHLLTSMEDGAPDYAALTPGMAAVLKSQYPQASATMKSWGPLKRLDWFFHTDGAGADHYLAQFENVQAYCAIMPLTPDGKITDERCDRGTNGNEGDGYQVGRFAGKNCPVYWPAWPCY